MVRVTLGSMWDIDLWYLPGLYEKHLIWLTIASKLVSYLVQKFVGVVHSLWFDVCGIVEVHTDGMYSIDVLASFECDISSNSKNSIFKGSVEVLHLWINW